MELHILDPNHSTELRALCGKTMTWEEFMRDCQDATTTCETCRNLSDNDLDFTVPDFNTLAEVPV